jgi:sulfofructose kinase
MPDVEIICVGGAKFDLNAVVEAFPQPDARTLIDGFADGIGGQAITAAVAIARLGVSVGYCGVVGRDAAGEAIMARLEQEGVSTAWVERRRDTATSRSMNIIARASGTRAIITERALAPDVSKLPELSAAWLHFDDVGYPVLAALGKATAKRARFSIDGGNPIPDLDLHGIDLYAPTIARLAADYGLDLPPRRIMQKAIDDGARAVVATDGDRGSYVLSEGSFELVPGFQVEIVSTLGAGDVFHGALLAAICLEKSLPEALRWGNACAALSCRAVDGQSMAPRRDELERFLGAQATNQSKLSRLAAN